MDGTVPKLSCEQCRQRKKKCDKGSPCSSCKSAGLLCEVVQRARKPRGRSGKVQKGSALEDRVTRLEALLKKAEFHASAESTAPVNQRPSPDSLAQVKRNHDEGCKYIACDFWSALYKEVSGLRETVEASDEEDEDENDALLRDDTAKSSASPSDLDTLLFSLRIAGSPGSSPGAPAQSLRSSLLEYYQYRVDNVFKILHWPTVIERINRSHEPNQAEATLPSVKALEWGIYFAATCSITEDECAALGLDKSAWLDVCQRATECSLGQADLLRSASIETIQALVLYIQCRRVRGAFASSWTLLALAVRLGQGIALGSDETLGHHSILDIEVRRRLWYCIGLLDIQASLDRGTQPMLHLGALGTPPKNILDEDLHPDTEVMPPITTTLNPMSLSMLAFDTMRAYKMLNEASTWEGKLAIMRTFELSLQVQYPDNVPLISPLGLQLHLTASKMPLSLALLMRRPPYKTTNVVPADDDFDVLEIATKVLEGHFQMKEAVLSPWQWKEWIPWYALAVVLAELCKQPTGPAADRGFKAAQALYDSYRRPVSDPESGVLWKPITKLMRRVQYQRSQAAAAAATAARTAESQFQAPPVPDQTPNVPTTMQQADMPMLVSERITPPHPAVFDATAVFPPATGAQWPAASASLDILGGGGTTNGYSTALVGADLNAVYSGLDPANGVSWLDWDQYLQDSLYL